MFTSHDNHESQRNESEDSFLDGASPSPGVVESPQNPPLPACHLEIVSYQNSYGEPTPALALTKKLLRQLNTVFRCGLLIAEYIKEIDYAVRRIQSLNITISQLTRALDGHPQDQYPAEKLANLQEARDILEQCWHLKNETDLKLAETREELELPRELIWRDLKQVLKVYNLLEDSDLKHSLRNRNSQPQENFHPPSPTPFEELRYGGEDAHEAARNLFIEKRFNYRTPNESWRTEGIIMICDTKSSKKGE
jgi:hypothetical protein